LFCFSSWFRIRDVRLLLILRSFATWVVEWGVFRIWKIVVWVALIVGLEGCCFGVCCLGACCFGVCCLDFFWVARLVIRFSFWLILFSSFFMPSNFFMNSMCSYVFVCVR